MRKKSVDDILAELQQAIENATEKDAQGWRLKLASAPLAACDNSVRTPANVAEALETIVKNRAANKYLFSILLTCCVKKLSEPKQDVRIGQENMKNGYSNRSLDQRKVTPFLKSNGYTHCEASGLESGRNLERPHPWDLKYSTNPRGEGNRESFLGILHYVEAQKGDVKTVALYLLLCDRSNRKQIQKTVVPPSESQISKIMRIFERHFSESSGQGKSRLPVLALYAIYQRLIVEVGRYKGTVLLELERHTTADLRSASIGDIQVDMANTPFEGVEVKSEKPVTANMVRELPRKFNGRKVSRYYILSTSDPCLKAEDKVSVEKAVADVESETGTQVIVNGLIRTLWYYLRLLKDPASVLPNYQALLETDADIRPDLKDAWNSILNSEYKTETSK